jgi:hypothetical protein
MATDIQTHMETGTREVGSVEVVAGALHPEGEHPRIEVKHSQREVEVLAEELMQPEA